jgi:aldehyde dehydrogenase (NAD+)
MELNILLKEIVTALDNVDDWAAPKYQPKDLLNKFNTVYVQAEPFGVVLNISAWNFPFQLTLSPLIGAIAAGETMCVTR